MQFKLNYKLIVKFKKQVWTFFLMVVLSFPMSAINSNEECVIITSCVLVIS